MTETSSTKPIKYLLTHESVTVFHEGQTHVFKKGSPNFKKLSETLTAGKWDEVLPHLTITKSLETWSNDKFKIEGNTVTYLGQAVPREINDRIVSMATNGENPTILFNFWERLSRNPSYRSVNQLYGFLKHGNIPLTPEGKILTYKSVRDDYKDVHSGMFDNRPGTLNKMPRNQISDDPTKACHEGFHVGAMGYVRGFHSGGKIVVCEVDPEHVVCVPHDASSQKMRVCEYLVIGNYGADLPSTSVTLDDLGRVHYDMNVASVEEEDEDKDEEDEEIDENDSLPGEDDEDEEGDDIEEEDGDEDEIEDADPEELEATRTITKDETPEAQEPPTESLIPKPEKAKKGTPSEPHVVKKKPNKGFAKLDKMDMAELTKQSLDDLRKYATYGLEIIGASKIPGGKIALISRILQVRE